MRRSLHLAWTLIPGPLLAACLPEGTVEKGDSGDTDSGDTDSGDTDSGDTDSGDTDSGDPGCDLRTWYADGDQDGFGDPATTTEACDRPDGYTDDGDDCDDDDDEVHPKARERCNDVDDDCDGDIDNDAIDPEAWYIDVDRDGFGDSEGVTESCDRPAGYVRNALDCDDQSRSVNPDAFEVCNEKDDDCDGDIDDDDPNVSDQLTWYLDDDSDGYGTIDGTTTACTQPTGFADNWHDCDDSDAEINPDAAEICNEEDDDCDGDIDDDDDPVDGRDTFYADSDSDGFGDPDVTVDRCEQPAGYTDDATDCDDSEADVNPGGTESCNDRDDDCDGGADEGLATSTYYADDDSDGFGDGDHTVEDCALPGGYVSDDTDCDDSDAGVNPKATEVCNDGVDNDCDEDADECRFVATQSLGGSTTTGGVIRGDTTRANVGYAATTLGDWNADGAADFAVGAPYTSLGLSGSTTQTGEVCVSIGGLSGTVALSKCTFVIAGGGVLDQTGYSLASPDLDDDGTRDLVVGAPRAVNMGGAFWFAGPLAGTGSITTSAADDSVKGASTGDKLGCALVGGDFSDDGVDDLAYAACDASTSTASGGSIYITEGSSTAVDLSVAHEIYGSYILGNLGYALATHDDNADGVSDLIAGAPLAGTNEAGAVFLFQGPITADMADKSASAVFSGGTSGDFAGASVSSAGDANGDGYDDVVFSAPDASGMGVVYLIYGPGVSMDASKADFIIEGTESNASLGSAVAGGTDLDGDGAVDLLVGANGSASGAGVVYVFYGLLSGTLSTGDYDARFTGATTSDAAGARIEHVGDADGDGTDDFIVGAPKADYGAAANGGAAYLILGSGM